MQQAGPLIAIVAGEASGDNLGAALIEAIKARQPQARFIGVPGPRMRAAGCAELASCEELAVMGLIEILRHLPRLIALRRRLLAEFVRAGVDVFVGIDAPEFNLGLAKRMKARGVATVQYVSPQVWAWRQGRVRGIGAACDRILCVLPFEPPFYARHGIEATFVGHPLADQFPLRPDRAAARAALGVADDAELVALLPGSRKGEVGLLAEPFLAAARLLAEQRPGLSFIVPLTNATNRQIFAAARERVAPLLPITLVEGRSREVLAAANVALVASGTATLETLLTRRPMVVAYRLNGFTAFLLRRLGLVKVQHFSQPNLLAERELVPEFFQESATPAALAAALRHWLETPAAAAEIEREFERIHLQLRQDGASLAAAAVLELAASAAAR